jgi:hypothetical protein
MTLSQFAYAIGARPKWVQNAARLLGHKLEHSPAEAELYSLICVLHRDMGMALGRAETIAQVALAARTPEGTETSISTGPTTSVTFDMQRHFSDYAVRLAAALSQQQARRRGRPSGERSMLKRARDFGIDLGLLEASLRLSAGARLRRLDENQRFVAKLAGRA